MTSKWRILDLLGFQGKLCSERGAIRIVPDAGDEVLVPVDDLAVVLVGMTTQLSAAVLHRLCQADVALLFCDWKGVPEGGAYSWSDHTRVGARQRAQAHLTLPRQKNAWGRVIQAKIFGQSHTLRLLASPGYGELKALAMQVRSGDSSNLEAQAARIYWRYLLGAGNYRIPHAHESSGRNACLDYGYSVLRGHAIRAVLSAGLSPAVGIFHHGRGNLFALADDLIEPFRPVIDAVVFHLDPDADVRDSDIKRILVGAVSQAFDVSGETIPTKMTALAQDFGRYCEGDIDRLAVPVWSGVIDTWDLADG